MLAPAWPPTAGPTPSFASIAAVGFALTAYPIGVARGWITREQARERTLSTLRFFHDAPQGPEATGVAGHKGFFYHFLDMESGTRFGDCELSTIDTALLLAGALHVQSFFDGADDAGNADPHHRRRALCARRLALGANRARADRPRLATRDGLHRPRLERLQRSHAALPAGARLADACRSRPKPGAPGPPPTAPRWGTEYGQTYLRFPPLFGHQFTHAWVDLRGMQRRLHARSAASTTSRTRRRATLAQRAYAVANPAGWAGYGARCLGRDAPATARPTPTREYGGKRAPLHQLRRPRHGASATTARSRPMAPARRSPFAPEIVVARAGRRMRERYGEHIFGRYGFFAFNPSFTFSDVQLRARPRRARLRLGRHRLPRHRGRARCCSCSPTTATKSVWKAMRRNAAPQARAAARRFHRRLAGLSRPGAP